MDISGIALAFAVLLLIGVCWFGLHYLANPPLEDADATARVTGNCGDTMELALRFCGDKVERARHWTDGCSVSNQCIEAAAMLAGGKSPAELKKINMIDIMDIVGQLPETHLHCAQLAETTLQLAVKEFLQKSGTQS
jgi:NifU-like protein involved in Fe-S cluster formation